MGEQINEWKDEGMAKWVDDGRMYEGMDGP